jgi:putative glutamine amidotransferase
MAPRIAIPMPHGVDLEYAERAIPQYERAIAIAGGEPVRIGLHQPEAEAARLVESCAGVLLPGSKADVDPARFHATRSPHTVEADARREAVDNLLLDDAFRRRKPVLGICYGLQSLNVYRGGSLVQHIPDFLPAETRGRVNHEAGKKVAIAHRVEIEPNSELARILSGDSRPRLFPGKIGGGLESETVSSRETREGHSFSRANQGQSRTWALAPEGDEILLPVNSSHHQSAEVVGRGLRVSSRCPDDGIVEALEGTAADHFVLAVQWHPERSVEEDEASRAILRALVRACIT